MNPVIKEVKTDGFRAMIDGLMAMSGKSFEEVLLQQAAALLKVCIAKTPVASTTNIIKRVSKHNNHIEFSSGHVISLWKKVDRLMFLDDSNWSPSMRGKAPNVINGKTWHDVGWGNGKRWSAERWGRYQAFERLADQRKIDPKKAKQARGLSKQSWLQIAQDLGVQVPAPGYVSKAKPSNGKTYKNGVARKFLDAAAAYIEISNDNPLVVGKLDGWGILQRALRTRQQAYQGDLRRGVFKDLKTRAQRYPGIFTDPNA